MTDDILKGLVQRWPNGSIRYLMLISDEGTEPVKKAVARLDNDQVGISIGNPEVNVYIRPDGVTANNNNWEDVTISGRSVAIAKNFAKACQGTDEDKMLEGLGVLYKSIRDDLGFSENGHDNDD